MKNKPDTSPGLKPNNAINIDSACESEAGQIIAQKLLEPHLRHGVASGSFSSKMLSSGATAPGCIDYADKVRTITEKAQQGDLTLTSDMLAAQSVTLDSMFTEFARRASVNMGEYPQAAERYSRLAMKAQANSRATLEALIKLHRPREQTVKHVHVNDGGQAVVADEFHHHARRGSNEKVEEQSHATSTTGEGYTLLGEDPKGHTMPITSSKWEKQV